jgi:hypothetical protein
LPHTATASCRGRAPSTDHRIAAEYATSLQFRYLSATQVRDVTGMPGERHTGLSVVVSSGSRIANPLSAGWHLATANLRPQ